MSIYLVIAGIAVCIFFSAYFSASEMSYSSCNPVRLEKTRDGGSKKAGLALKIVDRYDDALGAILIGNNLVNIAASSLGSVLVIMLAGEENSDKYTWVATLVITVLVIIFGETIPKICAKKSANRTAEKNAGFIHFLMVIFKPVIWLVVNSINLITKGMKGTEGDEQEEAVDELHSIIETAEDEEVLDEDQSELVQAAIDFSEISASEVMTARVDVVAIDVDDDWEDILSLIEEAPYSRLPVYEDSIDNIIGVLYLNRFLKAMTEQEHVDIKTLLMPPCYVYKTMKLPAVLSQLRSSRQHLAVVSDEYGGTLGVLSMEDVLEQIVGEIWDETDDVELEVVRRNEGEYELDGDMVLDDFLELMGINEENFEADSDTVGGWTVERFGAYPKPGDSFRYENIQISVLVMDGRRVERVLAKVLSPDQQNK